MTVRLQNTYDYIIVGAGSSGAVLASRLTENANTRVLLLESGADYRSTDAPHEMRSANPLGIMNVERFGPYQWPDLLVRRTSAQAPRLYDRGRGPGGSSAINWQIAHRAELEDFDWWAEQGCEGWSGEELLPAMNRLERDLDFGDAPYHGRNGPVTIYRPAISRWGKVDLALLEAGLDGGHPWNPDLNAPESTGISATPVNRTEDNRVSTNDAYLEPARDRANLVIACDMHVDRVLFDGRRAIGVRALGPDGSRDAFAGEVILSAGSVFSPPILIRSGIGPADQLRALGVEVVADLPVGENLVDHAAVGLRLWLKPEASAATWDDRIMNCYVRYSSGLAGAGRNDMVLNPRNLNGYDEVGLSAGGMSVLLWQTFSRGTLRVVDLNPMAMPVIDERLLSDERDMQRMRAGARDLFEVGRHSAVGAIAERVVLARAVTDHSDLTIDDVTDQRALDRWILESVRDTWHLVGTCRMGAADDPRSVVDPDCGVIGVENLRVIDGSIMPEVPRANTNLTCMAIGEHMAARLSRTTRTAT
jgi:5-(hydroxymethyl)furfural/furfural oxidase